MELQAIKGIIEEAGTTSRVLNINGYVDSRGNVWNYVVRMLRPTGYERLVAESLAGLDRARIPNYKLTALGEEAPAVMEAAEQARQELRESFIKTLAKEHTDRSAPKYMDVEGQSYKLDPKRPEVVVLPNLQRIAAHMVEGTTSSPVKSAPKTIAKKLLKAELPVDTYIGQLILAEVKVADMEVGSDEDA